jgi:YidC/Oxa1 family membrane protein insertase
MSEIFTTLLIQPLANGLILFYDILWHNMGLAIIFFSIFLRFVLNPLTKPYMESMKKMKDLAPQLDKIKKKYKGDKAKLAQAQSDLYKQKKVNPGAGCIPYLIQIVILIAFFRVFTLTLSSDNPTASFNQLLYEPLKLEQGQTINTDFLYLDITEPDTVQLPFLPFAIPGPLLILAAVVQLFSSKMMTQTASIEQKEAKDTEEKSDDIQAAMQKSMVYTFPIFTLFIGMRFPSGLVLYWIVFSGWQFVQQYTTYGSKQLDPWLKRLGLLKSDVESDSDNKNGRRNRKNKNNK